VSPGGPALALALLLFFAAASPTRAQQETLEVDLSALVETLRTGDAAARAAALRELAVVAGRRPDDLRRLLAHPDPDVRFQVLFLLSERDAFAEQRVRQIVEGRPALAGTYPQALQARDALLATAAREVQDDGSALRSVERLARLARRRATGGELGARYVVVALDIVAELLRRDRPLGDAAAEIGRTLAALTEVDLDDGFHELAACFAALPAEAALGALRAVIGGGAPLAQARAARVLGEITDASHADQNALAVRPLLAHALPEVRLAALRALSVMPLGDDALIPAAALARDPQPAVAEEALRLAGERRLAFAREAAERVAGDGRALLPLRRQAVRTIGLIGNPASVTALRPLLAATTERELRLLAAWALGATRAPGALEAIRELLADAELRDDHRLFTALARLGPPGVEALGAMLEPGDGAGNARRIRAIRALGRATPDEQGGGPGEAVAILWRLAKSPLAQRLGDARAGSVTENELELVARALGDLAPIHDEARAAVARFLVERGEIALLDALLPIVAEVGPPLDPALAQALRQALTRYVSQVGGPVRPLAATALLRVDPAAAREVLGRIVGTPPRGLQNEDALELMRVLARAGDTGPVKQLALPLARERLDAEAPSEDRFNLQNRLGIELLYAHELEEARLEFRRMIWCRPTDPIPSYNIACGHALDGRVEEALRALRRCIRHGYRDPQHMLADSDLDSLRGDPRFQRLMQRLQLEDETGVRMTNDTWPKPPVPQ
jgi:hypothetical protein